MSITQKELINEIREEQKRMAIEQLKLATNLSIFMNKQDLFNQKVIDILETNPMTKRKGIVEELENVKSDVEDLKTDKKVTRGQVYLVMIASAFFGWIITNIINIFK